MWIATTWDGHPVAEAEAAQVQVSLGSDALVVSIDAPYFGDPPPQGPPGPTDGLWEHEVVELFVVGADDRYTEVEIGPHGHYLVLQLHGVRNVVASCLPMALETAIAGGRWTAVARLDPTLLPPRPWRGNAFAIHGTGVDRRYLAAHPVPGPQPDFHRLRAFPPLAL